MIPHGKDMIMKLPIYPLAISGGLALLLSVVGCQSVTIPPVISNPPTQPTTPDSQQTITQQAMHIQRALANNDYAGIINDIHPTKGVRFSMYAYVHLNKDKVFSRAQFAQYLRESKIRFTWGEIDGAGETYIEPLPVYLDNWIDAKKFDNARVTVNKFETRGNMINNVLEAYPGADVVDFVYSGSDKYDGMDWRGMRLVFENYQGKRYLVGIVNDRWTV
ncbi:hypothetical protein AOC03_01640 [Psychrobacter urativorans]|uniref:Lipoprotein n=2 Tax=Psychrobacter urativorans TaxID=45610 RepID=A0A0M5MKK9_9GAMM|nr:hypothetical protein AOC03_01640 [Psychrobacter urativorans]